MTEPLSPQPLPSLVLEGLSQRTLEEHYKLYREYVNRANDLRVRLAALDRATPPAPLSRDLGQILADLTGVLNAIRNHELYFANLGGRGGRAYGRVAELLDRDYGSFEHWTTDFTAAALAAPAWVWLVLDLADGRLRLTTGQSDQSAPGWEVCPVLGLDLCEHAYVIDFGVDRLAYIRAFLRNVDWDDVNQRVLRAERLWSASQT